MEICLTSKGYKAFELGSSPAFLSPRGELSGVNSHLRTFVFRPGHFPHVEALRSTTDSEEEI
jgi:hypothetical protein